MKEQILETIYKINADMGYRFLCITEEDTATLATKLHALFVQSQIDMLEEINKEKVWATTPHSTEYEYMVECREIQNKITSLKQQLNTVK